MLEFELQSSYIFVHIYIMSLTFNSFTNQMLRIYFSSNTGPTPVGVLFMSLPSWSAGYVPGLLLVHVDLSVVPEYGWRGST